MLKIYNANNIKFFISNVFFEIGSLPAKTYFIFKFKTFQQFIITTNKKTINLKLKLKRHQFKKQTNMTNLTGFYHGIW
jgi:hypothetical protein